MKLTTFPLSVMDYLSYKIANEFSHSLCTKIKIYFNFSKESFTISKREPINKINKAIYKGSKTYLPYEIINLKPVERK